MDLWREVSTIVVPADRELASNLGDWIHSWTVLSKTYVDGEDDGRRRTLFGVITSYLFQMLYPDVYSIVDGGLNDFEKQNVAAKLNDIKMDLVAAQMKNKGYDVAASVVSNLPAQ